MTDKTTFRDKLIAGADTYGLDLSEHALDLFWKYTELTAHWNKQVNLVSARDMERFLEYHLLDSLKMLSCVDFTKAKTIMDFGSGAGLPGIPIALAFPESHVTLVDSRLKRCNFLTEIVKEMPLDNVTVLRSRVEDMPKSSYGTFNMVITRATVDLLTFFSLSKRFLKNRGRLVAIKGPSIESELEMLDKKVHKKLFNILSTEPKPFGDVRQGVIVTIKKR